MSITERLSELESALEEAEHELVSLRARIAGLQAERDALAAAGPRAEDQPQKRHGHDWAHMKRTDAICELLESEPHRAFSIHDVVDKLSDLTEREEDYQVVSSTLSYLAQQNRIMRTGHGIYRAI